MPLPAKSKLGISACLQPLFTQQLGIFGSQPPNADLVDSFLNAIPAKYRLIDLHLNEDNHPGEASFEIVARTNHLLPLFKPYEEVRSGYGSQAVRNLKKAKREGLQLVASEPEDVVTFYERHKSEETIGVKSADYMRLRKILQEAGKRKLMDAYQVHDTKGNVLASAAFLKFGNRVTFLIGNASPKGRNFGAMTYLMDEVIRANCAQDKILDFEGSEIPGIARFFQSFGAAQVSFPRIKRNTLPWILRTLRS